MQSYTKKEYYEAKITIICKEAETNPHALYKLFPKQKREEMEEIEDENGRRLTAPHEILEAVKNHYAQLGRHSAHENQEYEDKITNEVSRIRNSTVC